MNNDQNTQLLESIIINEDISVVFQPIFDISRQQILGYEALSRGPVNTPLHSPEVMFGLAEQQGRLSELELVCRKLAIARFVALELSGKLFLNISPQVLLDRQHPKGETMHLLQLHGLDSHQVVIEITEQQQVDDALLKQAVNYYRKRGFTIAIDDLGSGHSGLRQWSELMPDIVKIDRYFIENCHRDVVKKEFLKFILSLANATQAVVIAEGIEKAEELRLLAKLGVCLTQGYLLEKPSKMPSTQFPDHINDALGHNEANDVLV